MKVLTQLSGGLDSVAMLAELASCGAYADIYPVFFNYGQPYASQERAAARYATRFFQEKHPAAVHTLYEVPVPLHVTSTTKVKEYVPYRNLALTAVSVNMAASLNCSQIAVGSKSLVWRPTDEYSFKDSTAAFFTSLVDIVQEATEPMSDWPDIIMPLVGWTKGKVIARLMQAEISLHRLWSCYENAEQPCGKCYHCLEIEKAMHDIEVQSFMHREMT